MARGDHDEEAGILDDFEGPFEGLDERLLVTLGELDVEANALEAHILHLVKPGGGDAEQRAYREHPSRTRPTDV